MSNIRLCIPTVKSRIEIQPLVEAVTSSVDEHLALHISSNAKFSASENRNACLSECDLGDAVIMMDDDIQPNCLRRGWINCLIEVLNKHPLDIIAPRLFNPSGGVEWHPRIIGRNRDCSLAEQIWVTSALICFHHDGQLFDTTYRGSGFEDADFCRRRRSASGSRSIVIESLKVIHLSEKKGRETNWLYNSNLYKTTNYGGDRD